MVAVALAAETAAWHALVAAVVLDLLLSAAADLLRRSGDVFDPVRQVTTSGGGRAAD